MALVHSAVACSVFIAMYCMVSEVMVDQLKVKRGILQQRKRYRYILEDILPPRIIDYLSIDSDPAGGCPSWSPRSLLSTSSIGGDPYSLERLNSLGDFTSGVFVCFADIVGFTKVAASCPPCEVMRFLSVLFSAFDQLTELYDVRKMETIGDCYVTAAGIKDTPSHQWSLGKRGRAMLDLATSMLEVAASVEMPVTGAPVQLRIGMHAGDVMTGVVGFKAPRFSIFGDTINVAARMEQTGAAGRVHVSEAVRAQVPGGVWESREGVAVKGKGVMDTFFLRAWDGGGGSSSPG